MLLRGLEWVVALEEYGGFDVAMVLWISKMVLMREVGDGVRSRLWRSTVFSESVIYH